MSTSDKTFIRVYRKNADPVMESVDSQPEPQTVQLGYDANDKLGLVVDESDDDNHNHAAQDETIEGDCVPKVIYEVFDFDDTTGTNVITTGLFLDAVDEIVQQRTAQRSSFAGWEVDRFALPRPCEVIEEFARETLDDVAGRVLQSLVPSRNLVSVRSWARGAGRTTLAVCMARRLAYHGKSVVLVDGDFDNPQLASHLGIQFDEGWDSALLNDSASPASSCISSVRDGFSILPLSDGYVDFVDPSIADRMKQVLSDISNNFDIVMVDAGPGSQIWDHPSVADQLGTVIVQDNRRPETEIDDLVERMKRRGTTILGLIENFSKAA